MIRGWGINPGLLLTRGSTRPSRHVGFKFNTTIQILRLFSQYRQSIDPEYTVFFHYFSLYA